MFRKVSVLVVLFHSFAILAAGATQFLEAPQFQTGTTPQAVAVADLNNDGKTDLVVANSSSNTISILLGNGDGTYQAKKDYATGSTPQGIAIADFNGDGILDIAVTDSGSNAVSILFGNGDGTFQAKVDYVTGNQPTGIAEGDFNGDGHPDLVVTNAKDGTIGVLMNNGHGVFGAPTAYNTGFNPWSVVVADFNGDGKLDIATANKNINPNNMVSVFLGNGDGTFSTQKQSGSGKNPVSIAAADVNGDGKLDLVVADEGSDTVSVLIGKGDGFFQPNVDYPTAPSPEGVILGDFNGDGLLDIAVTARNGNTVSVLLNDSKSVGTFNPQVSWGVGNTPYGIVAADLNGDKKLDLVVSNSGSNTVSVVIGNGDGTFQTRLDYAAGPNPYWVATGDFNGDGITDLAVVTRNCIPSCSPGVSIVLGNGNGSFQVPNQFSTGNNTDPRYVAVADLNGDGKPDLAVANYATGTVSVMLGDGQGNFPTHVDYLVGSEPNSVAVADVNNDGKPDLIVANFHSNTVSVLLGNGDGTFKTAVSYPTGNGPVSVAAADFNGDHKIDLVVVNETDSTAGILLGNGDGTFKPQVTYSVGAGGNPLSVAVGDFNGDGNLDLAVADFQTQQASILLGNGDGTFGNLKQYPTGANPSSVVIGDFNGDGKLDLALTSTPVNTSPGNLVSLLLGDGTGKFGPPAVFPTGSEAYSAAVGDFNGDGALDLAVANGISNTVSILLNTQGTFVHVIPSGSPSAYGQTVAFTTTVAVSMSGDASPTGTVTVRNGSTVIGSGTLTNGEFIASTSVLPTGTLTISATYSGDSNFQPHTVTVTQTVQQAGTSTLLTSSGNPSGNGQPVTFTATVTSDTSGTPTGSVNFQDSGVVLGSAALTNGAATFTTSSLTIGPHNVTGVYGGDSNFNGSTSPLLVQTVGKGNTTTTLALSGNLKLVATVTSGMSGTPTGSVAFMDGTNPLGSANLDASATATLSTSALAAGVHSVTAVFTADPNSNFNNSTSAAVQVTADFSLSASTMSPGSVAAGQQSTSSVTVTPANGFDVTKTALACSVAPAVTPALTCAMGSIAVTNGTGVATLTVKSTGSSAAHASLMPQSSGLLITFIVILMMLLGTAGLDRHQRTKLRSFVFVALVLGGCLFQAACGGGSSSSSGGGGGGRTGTPSGTYTITITGSQNSVQHTTQATLTIQ